MSDAPPTQPDERVRAPRWTRWIPRTPGIRQLYLFYLKRIMPCIAGWITGQREAYVYLCGSIERFPSGEAMEALICANGFQSAHATRLTLGIASLYEAKKAG